MKVKELIEKLSQLDPELMVVVRGYEGGMDIVTGKISRTVTSERVN